MYWGQSVTELQNGWGEWSKYVLTFIQKFDTDLQSLSDKIQELKIELVVLKVKAAMWGAIAALIVSAIISALVSHMVHSMLEKVAH